MSVSHYQQVHQVLVRGIVSPAQLNYSDKSLAVM